MKPLKSNSGFSLIELMVVVAIIGILATIAVPQISKFQARARQSEVKGHMANLYTAEKGFFAEYSTYSTDLGNIGFGTEGSNLRYNAGFTTNTPCTNYGAVTGRPPEHDGGSRAMLSEVSAGTANWLIGAGAPAVSACDATVFTASGWGDPNTPITGTNTDEWTIDNTKTLTNTNPGIN